MQTLFLSIIRVMWVSVCNWMQRKWGIQVDETTNQEVINWIMSALILVSAFAVDIWVHYLYPKFKAWLQRIKA